MYASVTFSDWEGLSIGYRIKSLDINKTTMVYPAITIYNQYVNKHTIF